LLTSQLLFAISTPEIGHQQDLSRCLSGKLAVESQDNLVRALDLLQTSSDTSITRMKEDQVTQPVQRIGTTGGESN